LLKNNGEITGNTQIQQKNLVQAVYDKFETISFHCIVEYFGIEKEDIKEINIA